jgi:spermidine synthase
VIAVYALAIFMGAFLLFQVQPIMGKYILPWFGGSPGVWTTCMLVFQLLLCGGYAYAHFLNRMCTPRGQILLHAVLLLGSLFTLPIAPSADWKPTGSEAPTLWIVLLLILNVGLPYFLLSATGPLLQSWVSRSGIVAHPYRLYALSNVGSLLALLSYPFFFETWMSSSQQAINWSLVFSFFAIVCPLAGILSLIRSLKRQNALEPAAATSNHAPSAIAPLQYVHWFVLAFIPSLMLLAVTNQVCLDVAVIPFLWILPLSIYLVSFILCFESQRWYYRRPYIALTLLAFIGVLQAQSAGPSMNYILQIAIYFSALFFACMVCHAELVRIRPATQNLTAFYMTMSIGGACGGLFVGLLAPLLFNDFLELQIGLILCGLVMLALYFLPKNQTLSDLSLGRQRGYASLATFALLGIIGTQWLVGSTQHAVRNFYGVLRVKSALDEDTGLMVKVLFHGRIVHGTQLEREDLSATPTAYYGYDSGVGLTLQNFKSNAPRNIGVVGLGAGTLATYAKSGDRWKFYEINPDVIDYAQKHFTFLSHCPAEVEVLPGDARLTLARESENQFDILILDAFSGDAIPVHLLTTEALEIYRRCLKPDGALVIHITNQYFDLAPIASGLAAEAGYSFAVIDNHATLRPFANRSMWAVLSANPEAVAAVKSTSDIEVVPVRRQLKWTDDRSNLFEALR